MNPSSSRLFSSALAGLIVAAVCVSARATSVDLTTGIGASGVINGAIYRVDDPYGPAGSGVLMSFVRINPGGGAKTEKGYNTSGRPVAFDENTSLTFTHDLLVGQVPLVFEGGEPYLEFLLDINEVQAQGNQFLSLDVVQIYTSPIGGKTTSNVASLGTLRYSTSPGDVVLLDSSKVLIGDGSGRADMTLLVPLSFFTGASSTDYLYLYSAFGGLGTTGKGQNKQIWSASDGYEEWATRGAPEQPSEPPPYIPEPLTMLSIALGVAVVGARTGRWLRAGAR